MGTKLDPHTKKITLFELDISLIQTLFFNYTAGVWYVDFDAIYDRIDPVYLVGVSAQSIIQIGSVLQDGVALTLVASVALVITTNNSYYWDASDRRVYIHLNGGSEPALHIIVLGITSGFANHACTYNGLYFEPRLRSAPAISKSKDPLFFGRISFDGGDITLDNHDGNFDSLVEGNPGIFGGAVRVLQGFDSDAYAAFTRMASGLIEGVKINRDSCVVTMVDQRKYLSRSAPMRVYEVATYPNLNYANYGRPIALAYGQLRGVPCVCLNEEAVAPATWDFKICDCTDHAIVSIDQLYSDGIKVTASASSMANGTFSLIGGDFKVGTVVKADIHGYATTNAADVIADILLNHLGLVYNATNFNTTEWAVAQAAAMDVGVYVGDSREVFAIIEDICASALMNFIQQDDGRYTLRIYDAARAIDQTLNRDELLGTPAISHDPTQVVSSVSVGYDRDWTLGSFQRLKDTSQEAVIFALYKHYRQQSFETLLTSAANAQTYATAMLALYGHTLTRISARFKLQPLGREVMDFVMLPVYRQTKTMLGMVKCEVYSISKDLLGATVELGCRVV
ncbi:MAG TPA: hypothetical protein VJ553_03295 [Candidatus Paceibacterota bacterium]|nr:hypothetical protein [Candidatus Paceibacterota bacterium]